MSLLPNLAGPKKKKLTPEEEELRDSSIQHPGQLIDQMQEIIGEEKISPDQRREATQKGKAYRTVDHWSKFTLKDVTGNVTPRIWGNMVNACLKGQRKTIEHSQPNGDWQVMDYECDIMRDADNLEQIVVGCRWVDMDNQEDLQYRGGHPVSLSVNVQGGGIPEEFMDALTKSAQTGGDAELKGMLAKLIELMAKREEREVSEPPEIDVFPPGRDSSPAG